MRPTYYRSWELHIFESFSPKSSITLALIIYTPTYYSFGFTRHTDFVKKLIRTKSIGLANPKRASLRVPILQTIMIMRVFFFEL
jgi:hypothetical protein